MLPSPPHASATAGAAAISADAAAAAAPAVLPPRPRGAPTSHAFFPTFVQPGSVPAPSPTSASPTSRLWPPLPDSLANPYGLALADSGFLSNLPVAPPPPLTSQLSFPDGADGRRAGGPSLPMDYHSAATASAASASASVAAAAAAAATAASLPPSVLQQLAADHLLLRQLHPNYTSPFSTGSALPFPPMPFTFPPIPLPPTLDPSMFAGNPPFLHRPPDYNAVTNNDHHVVLPPNFAPGDPRLSRFAGMGASPFGYPLSPFQPPFHHQMASQKLGTSDLVATFPGPASSPAAESVSTGQVFPQLTSFAPLAIPDGPIPNYSAPSTPQQPLPTFSLLHNPRQPPPPQGSSQPKLEAQQQQQQQPSSSSSSSLSSSPTPQPPLPPPPPSSASSRKTICQHSRRRTQCVACYDLGLGGGSICVHRKRRDGCPTCRAMRHPASGGPSLPPLSPTSTDPQDPATVTTCQKPKRKRPKRGSLVSAAAPASVDPVETRWSTLFPVGPEPALLPSLRPLPSPTAIGVPTQTQHRGPSPTPADSTSSLSPRLSQPSDLAASAASSPLPVPPQASPRAVATAPSLSPLVVPPFSPVFPADVVVALADQQDRPPFAPGAPRSASPGSCPPRFAVKSF